MRNLRQSSDQPVAKRRRALRIFFNMPHRFDKSGSHCDNSGNIFGSATLAPFLTAALNEIGKIYAFFNIKNSYAFRTVELMSRN